MQLQIEERDRERDERVVHLMDLAGRALDAVRDQEAEAASVRHAQAL